MPRRIFWATDFKMCGRFAAASMRGRAKLTRRCRATNLSNMESDLQKKIADAIANPKNMGEMDGADSVGTVGSPNCGDMVRMWIKFREDNGKKVIDKATFQTFGCET